MIRVQHTLVSDEIVSAFFQCALVECTGLCCVAGDGGAPLEGEECDGLTTHKEHLRPHLSAQGMAVIDASGVCVVDTDGSAVTPLAPSGACAYAIVRNQVTNCGIEHAFHDGAFPFQKPISCHVYPIRVRQTPTHVILNLHTWHICDGARRAGKTCRVRLIDFLKDALIRRFSAEWFAELQARVDDRRRSL